MRLCHWERFKKLYRKCVDKCEHCEKAVWKSAMFWLKVVENIIISKVTGLGEWVLEAPKLWWIEL